MYIWTREKSNYGLFLGMESPPADGKVPSNKVSYSSVSAEWLQEGATRASSSWCSGEIYI